MLKRLDFSYEVLWTTLHCDNKSLPLVVANDASKLAQDIIQRRPFGNGCAPSQVRPINVWPQHFAWNEAAGLTVDIYGELLAAAPMATGDLL